MAGGSPNEIFWACLFGLKISGGPGPRYPRAFPWIRHCWRIALKEGRVLGMISVHLNKFVFNTFRKDLGTSVNTAEDVFSPVAPELADAPRCQDIPEVF